MRRKSFESAACPVARALDAIGDWWSLLIIRDAFNGISRFGEFQRSLGLAKNILAARLKTLVGHGILATRPAADGSAWQDYLLTEKGRDLMPVLVALGQWGGAHQFQPGETRSVSVDSKKGRPLRKLAVRAEDGRVLGFGDVRVAV
jgi:DNA-binding HxlR family transcriptional regulator